MVVHKTDYICMYLLCFAASNESRKTLNQLKISIISQALLKSESLIIQVQFKQIDKKYRHTMTVPKIHCQPLLKFIQ